MSLLCHRSYVIKIYIYIYFFFANVQSKSLLALDTYMLTQTVRNRWLKDAKRMLNADNVTNNFNFKALFSASNAVSSSERGYLAFGLYNKNLCFLTDQLTVLSAAVRVQGLLLGLPVCLSKTLFSIISPCDGNKKTI